MNDVRPADSAALMLERATEFNFFQLVLLLLRTRADAVPPGSPGSPRHEVLRFRPALHMAFASSDVESVERYDAREEEIRERFRITVQFMGLYGPASPMPNHFTEDLLWAGTDGEVERAFLDLFHHRLLSFVYAAWAKYRHHRTYAKGGADGITRRYLSLIGLGTSGSVEALGLPQLRLLRCSGLLGAGSNSAKGLEGLLRDHFADCPMRVEPFLSRRVRLPEDQTSLLGQRNCALGRTQLLGESVVDRAGAFRVEVGPVDIETYRGFLPGAPGLERLTRLVRFYVREPLDFEVRLRLDPAGIPSLRLGGESPMPLGLLSWICPSGAGDGIVDVQVGELDPARAGRAA